MGSVETKTGDRYTIRPYLPGDEEEIIPLLKLVFGDWRDLDFWDWMYNDNLLKMDLHCVGVAGDGEIVGASLSLPLKVKIGGQTILSTYGSDACVHPDHRRRGIYGRLNDCKRELRERMGVRFHYSHTFNPIVYESHFKTYGRDQWRFPISYYNRIEDIDTHLRANKVERAFLKKLGFTAVKALNNLRGLGGRVRAEGVRVSEMKRFDGRFEGFWQRISDHYNFILERSRKYMNWRYCDPRAGDYLIKGAEDGDGVSGYVVLKLDRGSDYPTGRIMDLLALPGRLDVVDALVSDALGYFSDEGVNFVQCLFLRNHPYGGVLKRHGFLDLGPQGHYVNYSYLGLEKEFRAVEESPIGNLHLCYSDIAF